MQIPQQDTPQPPKAAETPEERAALEELLGEIDSTEYEKTVPLVERIADTTRRIHDRDRVLAEAKSILVTTHDPNYKPQGWLMPIGAAVRATIDERKRLLDYRAELVAEADEQGIEFDRTIIGESPAAEAATVADEIDGALAES